MSPHQRWPRLVVVAALASLAGLRASAEVVLSSGSSCAIAWGPGGLQDTRVSEPVDAIPFAFSASSDPGLYVASQVASAAAIPGGFRFASRGSASTEFDSGIGGAGSSCRISFCAEGGEPYSLSYQLHADGDRERTQFDPPTAAVYATYQPLSWPLTSLASVGAFGPPLGMPSLEQSGELEAGCFSVDVSAGARDFPGSAEYQLDLTLGGDAPPEEECEGEELAWAAGRTGAFADPESWSPPQVPTFEDGGPCDTARVEGGGVVTIDLASALSRASEPLVELVPRGADRRAGRLHVFDTRELRLQGGTLVLDALNTALGERSLEVSNAGGLLLTDGAVAARHVGIGSGAGPGGRIEVVGPVGSLSTAARLGVGGGGEGQLLVRQGGQVTAAESLLGEGSAKGSAVVEDAGSLWRTANLSVGYGAEGSLEVQGGARVESADVYIGLGNGFGQEGTATVLGTDAAGNRSTWTAQHLDILNGTLTVEDGGSVDVSGTLQLRSDDLVAGSLLIASGAQVAAGAVVNEGVVTIHPGGLLFTLGAVALPAPEGGLLSVVGPASSAQIVDASLLTLEGPSSAHLEDGARVELAGPFSVGTEAGSSATLAVRGARPRESLLRADEASGFNSVVGAFSDAPAAERLVPTGTLELQGGRIELLGALVHDLVVDRLGRLAAAGGSLSIETPGVLENHGVVEGPFLLEADYVQGETGTRRATILFEGDPVARARSLDPFAAAGFPRRAVRKKPALPVAGPLVVMGDATLAGRVELQFGNGVAPRAGERFAVLDVSGTVTGSFAEVAIQGLVAGSFAFEASLAGGKLALTSTMDSVALPAVGVKAKKKLKEKSKKGAKIKVKRAGDTSAPLLVAYTVGGTAEPGVDYEALPGVIEIPARKKSATISVRPIADGLVEGPETIRVELAPNEAFAPGLVSSATLELVSKDR